MSDENDKKGTARLAESTTLQVLARLSMLATMPLVGATIYLGSQWLDGRFETQATQTRIVSLKVDSMQDEMPKLRDRVTELESTSKERGRAREGFERQTLTRLDRMQDAIVTLSNAVAALTATVKAQQQEP